MIDDVLRDLSRRNLRLGGLRVDHGGIEVLARIETRHNTVVRCRHAGRDSKEFALKLFNTNKRIWGESIGMEILALYLLGGVGFPVPALEYADTSLRVVDRPFIVTEWLEGLPVTPAAIVAQHGRIAREIGRLCAQMAVAALAPNPASFLCSSGSVHRNAMAYLYERALPSLLATQREPAMDIVGKLNRNWEAIPSPCRFALVVHDIKCEHVLVTANHCVAGVVDFDSYFADDPIASIAEFLAVLHTQLASADFDIVCQAMINGWQEIDGTVSFPRLLFRMALKNLHDAADACSNPNAMPGVVAANMASAAALTQSLVTLLTKG